MAVASAAIAAALLVISTGSATALTRPTLASGIAHCTITGSVSFTPPLQLNPNPRYHRTTLGVSAGVSCSGNSGVTSATLTGSFHGINDCTDMASWYFNSGVLKAVWSGSAASYKTSLLHEKHGGIFVDNLHFASPPQMDLPWPLFAGATPESPISGSFHNEVWQSRLNLGVATDTSSADCYGFAGLNQTTFSGTLDIGHAFNGPDSTAFDGQNVWVANYGGNSVNEINASTGLLVRSVSGGAYGFAEPDGLSFDGTHLWVANANGGVTEVDPSTGALIRTLSGGSYGFSVPRTMTSDGTHLWVVNTNSVTEVNESDGNWVQSLAGASDGFPNATDGPTGVAFDGSHLWVTDEGANAVLEFDPSNGNLLQTLSGGSYGFNNPVGIVYDGSHVWVSNAAGTGGSVTEINPADGSWVQTLSGGSYGFNQPWNIVSDGTHLWAGNISGSGVQSLTEINEADGSWVQTLAGSPYNFTDIGAMAFDGTHLWVPNFDPEGGLTEINASNGAWVATDI
jgi:hypothetical protein